jgi:hypothetical protein
MDDQSQEDVLLDVRVAEASKVYKFYLLQEKKILGTLAVILFLTLWEFMGGVWSVYNPIPFLQVNPMFMSAPSLIWKAAVQLFSSGEIWNDLRVSGTELLGGYLLAASFAIPFGIMTGWYKRMSAIFDPFINAMNAARRPSPAGYHMVGNWDPLQGRHYFSRSSVPHIDQCPRRSEDHTSESPQCGKKFWSIGMDGL